MTVFPSIQIEGGLLGPDVVEELLAGDLPGQKPADFGLKAQRNLTDEIAGQFADARALWSVFQHRLERLSEQDLATTVTRDAWVIPFLGLLGYEPRYNPRACEMDGMTFPISHRAGEAEDTPPLHIVGARQELGRLPPSGRPRLAPHSLLQEYLNRTEQLWGLVTNGHTLRLLRDCTFVRKQAYVEYDLRGMIEEQRFQDFIALYRLLHRSRLPRDSAAAGDCLLESYYTHSAEQGGRVRDRLRDGVEQCIEILANGFLGHPANGELRRRIALTAGNERLTPDEVYRQLLRLVYRFLFLLVSEDRGLLSSAPIYRGHYGVARLRALVDRRAAYTEHDDLWQSLRVLWLVLTRDDQPMAAALRLPVLNGELFARQALDESTISNRELLRAFRCLAWYQESTSAPPRRVNYAALDVEELGSVYESLLEFHPVIEPGPSGKPAFRLHFGSERKTTGSYYTPPQLVAEVVRSTLEPVIADRLAKQPKARAKGLLAIRVCDPACGSGHFLLAAARCLGKELARVQTGGEEPAPEHVRAAIREIVSHCIYGVDKNPLAVDLCRVALWIESHHPDKPLTFLDHRIRCGDSLVGVFDLEVLKDGIPDKAFEPLEGDDPAVARKWARCNRDEQRDQQDQQDSFSWSADVDLAEMARHSHEVDGITNDSPDEIRRKRQRFEQSHAGPAWRRQKAACDLWAAAFFQPLTADTEAITTVTLAKQLAGFGAPQLLGRAGGISAQQRFFHWPLEFPEVFADGGFDVVLSNPPWEHVKLKEQEFFGARDARIASVGTKAKRTRLIADLKIDNPDLYEEFVTARRGFDASRLFLAQTGRYPLAGRGRINTYAVFAELAASATSPQGRAGLIVPTGIATDDTTKLLFSSFVSAGRLADLVGFENEDFIFPAVHHAFKFCKITIAGEACPVGQSRIGFYIRRFSQLSEDSRFFSLEKTDFSLLNPNTGNCPIFRSHADAELTKAIYRRVPVLWREATDDRPEENPWRLKFSQGLFNMASDSHHFRTADDLKAEGYRREGNILVGPRDRYLPLYEAKMLHQFDHRFSTYEGATQSQLNVGILPQPTAEQKRDPSFVVQPRYWVREEVVEEAIPKYPEPLALAVEVRHRPSIQRVLALWSAGYHLNRGDGKGADTLLSNAARFDLDRAVARWLANSPEVDVAATLQRDFPLTEADVQTIARHFTVPEEVAGELITRFSPKWFLGWRDVCRATDSRTLIASACPNSAVGDKFLLAFSRRSAKQRMSLLGVWNSVVCDYATRQKVGGTALKYFVFKQLPVPAPDVFSSALPVIDAKREALTWFGPRVLELVYTAHDLAALAEDCGYDGPPFQWDPMRRFEIRCELDAAFFHLYLPCQTDGSWQRADGETPEQLATLRKHFATPRDAVAFILDQFPIVRQKDEQAHGRYRTKERILEIHDAMLVSQRSGRPYHSNLDPPPGERP